MRDQNRRKQQLVEENAAFRQQVQDLREEMRARKRVEDHLRRSMELCGSLLQLAPVAMARVDAAGHVVFANPAMGRLLGYPSGAELVASGEAGGAGGAGGAGRGRGAGGLFADEAGHQEVARRLNGEAPLELAATFRHHDGRELVVDVLARAVPMTAGGGMVFYAVNGSPAGGGSVAE